MKILIIDDCVDLVGGVYFDVPIDMYYTDAQQGLYINSNNINPYIIK